jgi:hypothetical protein
MVVSQQSLKRLSMRFDNIFFGENAPEASKNMLRIMYIECDIIKKNMRSTLFSLLFFAV